MKDERRIMNSIRRGLGCSEKSSAHESQEGGRTKDPSLSKEGRRTNRYVRAVVGERKGKRGQRCLT